jgi:hypothetical protein
VKGALEYLKTNSESFYNKQKLKMLHPSRLAHMDRILEMLLTEKISFPWHIERAL